MKPDTEATREAIDTAIWLEDWQRAQTLLLLAIVDELVAIAEYVNNADDDPKPKHARP